MAQAAVLEGQLALPFQQHLTVAYELDRLWGLDRTVDGSGWWSWRCLCGRDPGAEQRFATNLEADAAYMGWWHQHDNEPWANPPPGPPNPALRHL